MPSVITWTRLEPYARSAALDGGLRAEVRDPLWMVGRQWQLGELWGEDAGSPVQVRLRMDCTPLTRFLPGGVPASWYAAGTTPVAPGQRIDRSIAFETIVERERVRHDGVFAPRLATEAGLHYLRVLAQKGGQALRASVVRLVPLEAGSSTGSLDADTQRFVSLTARRVPDGALLASVLRAIANPASLDALTDPYKSRVSSHVQSWQSWLATLTATDRGRVDAAATPFLKWYDGLFREPTGAADSSWVSDRLEYELAVAAPTPQQEVLLTAPEHTAGYFDWYSFEVLPTGSIGAARTDLSASDLERERVRRTVLPTAVRYPGMPSARYWEFEDARVDFGAIAAGAQQLAHLLLIEFALVAGDDWWIVPVDMPVGSVATMRWVVVTDTFGDRTLVPSAREIDRTAGDDAWDLFQLTPDSRPVTGTPRTPPDLFLLAPVLGHSLQSDPIEEVLLLRDELANLAWAVERRIESPLGHPLDREEAHNRAVPAPPAGGDVAPATAMLRYSLASGVPPHWVPLFPWRADPGAPPIVLRRGGMPQGRILEPGRPATSPLLIAAEEVPRAGARVTRAFQYARWIDGSTHLWVGRRKTAGRGEGSSGLRFDILEPRTSQP